MMLRILPLLPLLLLACASDDPEAPDTGATLAVGKTWELTSLEGDPLVESTSISLGLAFGGELDGSAGLNRYHGTYTLEGAAFRADVQVATRTDLDRPEGVLDQERRYLALLEGADGFLMPSSHELVLTRGGRPVLHFRHQRLW